MAFPATGPARTAAAQPTLLSFGDFRLDTELGQLWQGEQRVELPPRPLALLAYLAANAGRVVGKDELLDHVWGTVHITEGVIKTAMSQLRRALRDESNTAMWLETVPRKGYRFVGKLQALDTPSAAVSGPGTAGNLPGGLTELIGRADALATLIELLQRRPLVTITGAGGVGKTTLALHAAAALREQRRDGVHLVELAPLAAGEGASAEGELCVAIAHAMQLADHAGRGTAALSSALQGSQALLLLDNAEHLREATAALVGELLARCPSLRLLVTSQVPLGLPREQLFPLSPLPAPERSDDIAGFLDNPAAALFVQRVSERLPGFSVTRRHLEPIADICQMLDGLPLALELAAARVPSLGVHGIAERLNSDFAPPADAVEADPAVAGLSLLRSTVRQVPLRQRSLADAVAWSCGMLTERQRALLESLAAWRCDVMLHDVVAAAALLGADEAEAHGLLDALVERSLLVVLARRHDEHTYRMLEGVRSHGLAALRSSGRWDAVHAEVAQSEAAYWRRSEVAARRTPQLPWIDRRRIGLVQLRHALRWCFFDGRRPDLGVQLLACTCCVWHSTVWQRLGAAHEASQWLQVALDQRAELSPLDDARLWCAYAVQAVQGQQLSLQRATEHVLAAAAALQAAGEPETACHAVNAAFHIGVQLGHDALRDEALACHARWADPRWGPLALRPLRHNRAYLLRLAGRAKDYELAMRDELRLLSADALVEAWVSTQGLLLALADQRRTDEAIEIAWPLWRELCRRGMVERHAPLAAVVLLLLVDADRHDELRQAMAEAAEALLSAGVDFMLALPLAALLLQAGDMSDAGLALRFHDEHAPLGTRNDRWVEQQRSRLAERLQAATALPSGDAAVMSSAAWSPPDFRLRVQRWVADVRHRETAPAAC
jgi:predicted ATPase/DNA-binding winged helix-turn-helix (wHTH) protein